jgi:hypothetical protein
LVDRGDDLVPPASDRWFRRAIALASRRPGVLRGQDVPYLLGLAWYQLSEESSTRVANAEQLFRRAVARRPEDWYAWLYLGHVLFDTGHFGEALRCSRRIPKWTFLKHDQAWRDLHLAELRCCCYLHQGKLAPAVRELARLVADARKCDPEQQPGFAELRATLQALLGQGGARGRG